MTSTRQTLADPAFSDAEGRAEPLRYLNLFRLVLAGLFLVAGPALNLGGDSPTIFFGASFAYLAAVLILGFPDAERLLGRSRLITLQVLVDVTLLTLIMWASGGYRSGMPILILIALAGAGLVGQGRMVLFYAAYATLAVLLENAFRLLSGRATVDFFTVGITCIGFFAIAQVARLLALRALANEDLARQRGADLASQLRLNRQIIQDMQDGVLVVGDGGVVRRFNPQAVALLGAGLREGGRLVDFAPALERELRRRTEQGDSAHSLRADASGKMLLARFLPAGEANETLVYLEDFDRIHNQIQQAKLAALGRLTASIAHEIRNPLASVYQAAELLLDEKRSEMQARLIRIIGNNAQRIDRLVADVLALGRRDEALPEALPLESFVGEFLDEFALTDGLGNPGVVVNRVPPGLEMAMDRTHLRQILWNLVGNARRHCSGGPGAVKIDAALRDDGRVALDVSDDGPGIPEGLRTQVFEPFFTTHSKGTGLGLYISRELAEANGAVLELCATASPGLPGAHFRLIGRVKP
ncbi:MAG TPA: ATP-binding protein [Zoogloea sp.]|uniref:sensor histidine kinase n=1 Tax=Zoogloea sp. TaxID=49181 RepID=UPI001B7887FC|nr:ATP-binding protein [Zoogloea sp.]MBP8266226.1 PAS domain-containing protein [Zoogloea sp.]HOB45018.1 ATP-binding protein [Zoogloea sp.]HQA09836.1 ATP-binding protein [Zoogloea sp.]HQE37650.1 ATP-binding protein [Zoogloea sp.]